MPFSTARRILLKISGELLRGDKTHGISWPHLSEICQHIALLPSYEFVLVIGGGNFFRGAEGDSHCPTCIADSMGMLATAINGLACLSALKKVGLTGRLLCARGIEGVGEVFTYDRAQEALSRKEVVICAGGLGHGAMTTDTAAVVRACELECDLILKGTTVAGIYSEDPRVKPDAFFHEEITYGQAIAKKLGVMDLTALTLAQEARKPIVVFSLVHPKGLLGLFQKNIPHSIVRHPLLPCS